MGSCFFDFTKIMGEQTMFDLNEKINLWRINLAQSQTFARSDIDELESHLREEIENLTALNLSDEEAFLVATHRLGRPDSLSEEFAKVNASVLWRKRLFWAGAVVFAWLMLSYIWQIFSRICQILAVFAGFRGHTLNVIVLLSQVTFFGVVVFALYLISRTKGIGGIPFFKIPNSVRGKIVLFIIVFMIAAGTLALNFLSTAVVARFLGVEAIGQISIFKAYQGLIRVVFLPPVLLLCMILIRPSKLRKVEV